MIYRQDRGPPPAGLIERSMRAKYNAKIWSCGAEFFLNVP